jgi:hypothetical protein
LFVVARDGAARAVLPMQAGTGHLRPLANWYGFRWRPLVSDGADGVALLTAIARDLKRRAWRVTFAPLPGEDGSANLLEVAFANAGWSCTRTACDVNHVLRPAGRSYAEYLATRPGPLRTMLKRKAGKVSIDLMQTFDAAAWAEYEAIYAASWKPAEGSPAFLRRFAADEGAAGRLRYGIARCEGVAVAAQVWTVESDTAFIHKLAHREDARGLSPGTSLTAAMIEQVIDRDGVTLIDFGTGDDSYKRDWMDEVRPRYRLDCLDPAKPRAWPYMARAALQHLAGNDARG